jgi:hypothetical protein
VTRVQIHASENNGPDSTAVVRVAVLPLNGKIRNAQGKSTNHVSCDNTDNGEEQPKDNSKGKVPRWGLSQHYSLWLIVLLTPKGVPSFISRGAAHQAACSDLS